jgi:hypothetical protein
MPIAPEPRVEVILPGDSTRPIILRVMILCLGMEVATSAAPQAARAQSAFGPQGCVPYRLWGA